MRTSVIPVFSSSGVGRPLERAILCAKIVTASALCGQEKVDVVPCAIEALSFGRSGIGRLAERASTARMPLSCFRV